MNWMDQLSCQLHLCMISKFGFNNLNGVVSSVPVTYYLVIAEYRIEVTLVTLCLIIISKSISIVISMSNETIKTLFEVNYVIRKI
jgi:hypothetical protein